MKPHAIAPLRAPGVQLRFVYPGALASYFETGYHVSDLSFPAAITAHHG